MPANADDVSIVDIYNPQNSGADVSRVQTVAVIGGGVAGPVAALALLKAGIQATIYEAYPNSADGVGGTLALAPNGLAALEIVDAASAVAAASQPSSRMAMTVGRAQPIKLPTLTDVGPLRVVARRDLYRALHDQAVRQGVPVAYGKRLVDVQELPDSAEAIFADGSRVRADVVIGADGVHSTVRRLIAHDAPGPHYTGMLGFEGWSDWAAPIDPETMMFAFGRKAYYLYWLAANGGTTWGVNLPHPRPLTLAEARTIPKEQWMRTLLETYGRDVPGGELLRHTALDALQINGALHIMPKIPHWYRGRMVLVGDAVHAPSNSSGQGASLAIESAIQLARCLRDIDDVSEAFATYERLRRRRVERVAARAARINQTKAPGAIGQAVMPILMRLFIAVAMKPEKTIGVEQRYRIDWDAPVASEPLLR
jgi:2-polyprenyl-6-methoxyphenol hydroxylase-like FAD-dependent oxidoreductase